MVTASALAVVHRHLIVTLAVRHKLPAVYYERYFVTAGGLISYNPDFFDQYRRAVGNVVLQGAGHCRSNLARTVSNSWPTTRPECLRQSNWRTTDRRAVPITVLVPRIASVAANLGRVGRVHDADHPLARYTSRTTGIATHARDPRKPARCGRTECNSRCTAFTAHRSLR
jgi:hypothetical protein